jgi:alkylation response protein AidB-like acyl-CoA dehydrogenase
VPTDAAAELSTDESALAGRSLDLLLSTIEPGSVDPSVLFEARFDLGLAWINFPAGSGGLGIDARYQERVDAALRELGAPDPFPGNPIGIGMVGPSIARHGTDEQRARYLRPLYAGREIWCQLFSEPGAGSDLPSLSTRAVRDGDSWRADGQKVWTSLGHLASFGLLLARTDPESTRHRGLTCFLLDMHAPGVDVRPLRQMTGESEFNEVFLDAVRIPDSSRLGAVGDGWNVAITTLLNERSAIGAAVAQHSAKPARELLDLCRDRYPGDGAVRDRVMRLWIETEVLRLTGERARQLADAGRPGPESSVGKLHGAELNQRVSTAIVDLLGPEGMLLGMTGADAGTVMAGGTGRQNRFLRARANTIEGGTSEIMRNVLAERVLGLPPEPRVAAGQGTPAKGVR